ncbi:MAG: hypothetical protein CUN54_10195, partial [Phototrophicales bacterium]
RFHRHVKMSIEQHTIYRHIKQTHIARMQLDWAALPILLPSSLPSSEQHPFTADLDIADLHRLINTATSHGGIQRLWQWLTALRIDVNTIHKRQAIVHELIPLMTFRDKLTMRTTINDDNLFEHNDTKSLQRWLQ